MKKLIYYLASYRFRSYIWGITITFEILFSLYHELWHWLFTHLFKFLTLGDLEKIRFNITGFPKIEDNGEGFTTYSVCMEVEYYSTSKFTNSFGSILITFAPVIGVIFLFIVSPWWIYPLYLSNLNTFWLSSDDIKQIKNYLK